MTTLYRPVLIETAEQAEGLPEGSLVRDVRSGFDYRARHALGGYLQADLDAGVDVEALVPIEAEEETVVDTADLDLDPEHEYRSDDPNLLDAVRNAPKRTRYTTPWKTSGPSPHRRGGCA